MRLIISPAKKMKVDTDSFPCHRLPAFLPQTQEILARLQRLSGQELKSLWKCSDKIALLNQQRLACMDTGDPCLRGNSISVHGTWCV